MPNRIVINQDSMIWLKDKKELDPVITSLPDMDEIGYEIDEYKEWFGYSINLILKSLSKKSPAIFYQTDRKYKGYLLDKSHLICDYALKNGYRIIWHKIVLKQNPNTINMYRPTFTHMICVGSDKIKSKKARPDVIYSGKMIYKNAMGLNACKLAIEYIGDESDTIIDPFCGQGSILAIANYYNKNAIGIDIDKNQCKIAETIKIKEVNK